MNIPTRLLLEVADMCNFKCAFCPPERRSFKMLNIEDCKKILDAAKETPILGVWHNYIQLNGSGEPLLYPQLAEAIKLAKERFPFCEITTNAYLLTEEKARELLETGIDSIVISLTGVIPEVYQHFQGSGIPYEKCVTQLERVIQNVKRLAMLRDEMNAKTYIQLRFIHSDNSAAHLKDYVAFWKGTGVDEVYVTSLWSFKRKRKKSKFKITRCSSVARRYLVRGDGEVYPCPNNYSNPHNFMGNIHETDFKEIITSEKFLQETKNRLSCSLDVVPKSCLACECRALRELSEELRNMRQVYYLKSPLKTAISRVFGPAVVIFERLGRYGIFFNLYFAVMRWQSKRIHDKFVAQRRKCLKDDAIAE